MLSDAVDRGKRLLRDRLAFGITPEQEDAFRKDGLRTDIKLARIGILLIFVPILVYVFNDYQFFGTSSEFFGLVALRGGLAVCSIALLYYLDKISDYRTYDRYLTAWLIVAIVSNLLINLTRPENYVGASHRGHGVRLHHLPDPPQQVRVPDRSDGVRCPWVNRSSSSSPPALPSPTCSRSWSAWRSSSSSLSSVPGSCTTSAGGRSWRSSTAARRNWP